ncbi:MAG: hypothetical protein COB07_12195 [Sulfurovum sp.]|nr:MAG: hypothetical protein COB07_12195 [Sulfurovum sp.]
MTTRFTDMLKETIIKDIKGYVICLLLILNSDVFREIANADGGVPKTVRNTYLPPNFGIVKKRI